MPKKRKTTSTEQFVDVEDIQDILVLMKDGSLRAILEVESVNFDLKSNDEQVAILRGFQDFLNALDFPLQVLIQSRKFNIESYLKVLDKANQQQTSDLMKLQITEYVKFIKGLSELANIMNKRFFVAVPYYAIEDIKASNKGIREKFKSIFSSVKAPLRLSRELVEKYRPQLEQRISVIIGGLSPLGLQVRVLSQPELISLYYEYYNPGQHA